SPVTRAIRHAIEASLTNDDKTSAWLPTWQAIVGPEPIPESKPEPRPESGITERPESGPLRSRSRSRISEDPSTHTPDGPVVHEFLKSFCELYSKHRHGAKYHVRQAKDVPTVRQLLALYGAVELGLMAEELLTTNDPAFINGTDRGIGILSLKASFL